MHMFTCTCTETITTNPLTNKAQLETSHTQLKPPEAIAELLIK